jgi:hypothetical protein
MVDTQLPFTKDGALKMLEERGATVLFEKVLTTSDASGSGRIVIPKVRAGTCVDRRG